MCWSGKNDSKPHGTPYILFNLLHRYSIVLITPQLLFQCFSNLVLSWTERWLSFPRAVKIALNTTIISINRAINMFEEGNFSLMYFGLVWNLKTRTVLIDITANRKLRDTIAPRSHLESSGFQNKHFNCSASKINFGNLSKSHNNTLDNYLTISEILVTILFTNVQRVKATQVIKYMVSYIKNEITIFCKKLTHSDWTIKNINLFQC